MTALFEIGGDSPKLASDSVWIAPSSFVLGKVELGEDVGIWFHSVLRGDNEPIIIGARTNIQEAAILHTDMGFPLTIGRDCTIGHRALLHGCTIGDNTLIGMGAMVMNGAKIGNNCLIGANTLITEGKIIPDNSLVMGAPGKIARTLTSDEIERIAHSAESYVLAKEKCRKMQPIKA